MLAVASACNEPQSPEQRPQLLLTDGSTLAVDVNTTLALPDISSTGSIDPDGYTVWVDGSTSQAVATNGVVTFSGLAGGDHEVALYGIAPNCAVSTPSKGPTTLGGSRSSPAWGGPRTSPWRVGRGARYSVRPTPPASTSPLAVTRSAWTAERARRSRRTATSRSRSCTLRGTRLSFRA